MSHYDTFNMTYLGKVVLTLCLRAVRNSVKVSWSIFLAICINKNQSPYYRVIVILYSGDISLPTLVFLAISLTTPQVLW